MEYFDAMCDPDRVVASALARKLERERDEARGRLAGIEDKMRVELGGHPDSELWGEAGLIAATMRCVDALGEVTDQRDRLADLVKQFISILDITEESDSGRLFHPTNITSCRAGDLQKAGELVEALRRASINQPHLENTI